MPDLSPFHAWIWVLGDGFALADVDGDVVGVHPFLELAHLWMLAPPPEQSRRLHSEVAHLYSHIFHLHHDMGLAQIWACPLFEPDVHQTATQGLDQAACWSEAHEGETMQASTWEQEHPVCSAVWMQSQQDQTRLGPMCAQSCTAGLHPVRCLPSMSILDMKWERYSHKVMQHKMPLPQVRQSDGVFASKQNQKSEIPQDT